jgi:sulfonate dioxygenase
MQATGKKSLFASPNFTSHIVGFKKEESDVLLNFLNLHIGLGIDFQVRVRWEPGTVVVFDNRTVLQ